MWYCSLDKQILGSGDDGTSEKISAFITPSGLFEQLRMPSSIKSAPQIYQCAIDNALYEVFSIVADPDTSSTEPCKQIVVFEEGEPDTSWAPSVQAEDRKSELY